MPESEANPMDKLLMIPLSEGINVIPIMHVTLNVILQNQIEIIALLKNKDVEVVREDVMEKMDATFKKLIDDMPKTITP